PGSRLDGVEIPLFERFRVEGVEVIHADDAVAAGDQRLGHVRADEPGSAGEEDGRGWVCGFGHGAGNTRVGLHYSLATRDVYSAPSPLGELPMRMRDARLMVVFFVVAGGAAAAGCSSTRIAIAEKFGYAKREQLVDRVQEARDGQQEAKKQF